ncbi:MAG: tetratricopeptide repeat protein [Desulfobacteraceae bacterium]|nr:tetratricopeptide repeat protein [Desulfobacteraceae bacterium]
MKQRINPIIPLGILIFLFLGLAIPQGVVNAQTTTQDKLPLAAGICVTRAQALFQSGKVSHAISLLEEFKKKKLSNNHYYIHFLLGNYYLTLNQNQDAIHCYQTSVQKNPAFCAGWLNLAKSLYESGFFVKAAMAFEKGYETSQTPKPIHLYYAAICHFQADASNRALAVFELLIKAHPDKISLAWKESLVNILFSLERYSQALPTLEELASKTKDEKKKTWQEILLYQYLSLKMKKKALAFAGFLTRTDPLEPKWWKALCHIHLNNNRFKQGLSALVIYGYLTPMTQKELMLAADLYLALDVPAKAALLYQGAIKETQTPDQFLKKILKIGQAWAMAHDQDKALAWIEKGLSNCQDIKLLRLKAQILYRQKKYARAADAYECLVQTLLEHPPAPDTPNSSTIGQAWLMLGYAALNHNQPDHTQLARAQKAFLKAAGFKKQQKSARQALGQIKIIQTNTNQQVN